jgi:hypothetical protein
MTALFAMLAYLRAFLIARHRWQWRRSLTRRLSRLDRNQFSLLLRLSNVQRYRQLLKLTEAERKELTRLAQSRALPAGDVFRARLILALASGKSYCQIETELQTRGRPLRDGNSVLKWRVLKACSRATKGQSRAGPRRPFKPRCCEGHWRSPRTEARIGPAASWLACWG